MQRIVTVLDTTLTVNYNDRPISTQKDLDTYKFQFDDSWLGYTKTAVFYTDPAMVKHLLIPEDGVVTIPWEILTGKPQVLYIGVFGVKDGIIKPTTFGAVRLREGSYIDGVVPLPPTPDVYQQIISAWEGAKTEEEVRVENENSRRNNFDALVIEYNGLKAELEQEIADGTAGVDALEVLEADYAAKALTLEQTYAPRLGSVESQLAETKTELETSLAQNVIDMQAQVDAVVGNLTIDSEVILARGGKASLDVRISEAEKYPNKENIFSRNEKAWQRGSTDAPYPNLTNRIITPVGKRVDVTGFTQIALRFSDSTKWIAVKQYDVNGVGVNDSSWKYTGVLNVINIVAGCVKIGYLVANADGSNLDINALVNSEVTCVPGSILPFTYSKSALDKALDVKSEIRNVMQNNTLNNLYERTTEKWINALYGGSATTPIVNIVENNLYRISMNVAYSGFDVSNLTKLYIENQSDFDIAILEIDVNRNKIKDSGWVTVSEYTLLPLTVEVYLAMKKKTGTFIYTSEVRELPIYIGATPYNGNMTSLLNVGDKQIVNHMFIPSKNRFVAHRGHASVAPENTLAAFNLAGQAGFWAIETDLAITSDGVLVIMHDNTVDRTTNGTGAVSSLTFAYLQTLLVDAGANIATYTNEKIPTFIEYLRVCKKYGCVPMIEIKDGTSDTTIDLLLATIKEQGFEDSCIIISFKMSYINYIRNKNKKIHLQPLLNLSEENIKTVANFTNASINSGVVADMETLIKYAHNKGISVNVNTINTETVKNDLINQGVDMIISDVFYE